MIAIYILSTIMWIWKVFPERPTYNVSIGDMIIYSVVFLAGLVPIFNTVAAISIIFDKLEEKEWFSLGEWLTKPRFNKR